MGSLSMGACVGRVRESCPATQNCSADYAYRVCDGRCIPPGPVRRWALLAFPPDEGPLRLAGAEGRLNVSVVPLVFFGIAEC